MNWISLKEKRPEYDASKEQIFIVSGIDDGNRYVHYAIAYAYGYTLIINDIFSVPGWSDMNVDYWMELPPPPS